MVSFRINSYIEVGLERGSTVIYIKDKRFIQCKKLVLAIPLGKEYFYDEINSVDDASDIYEYFLDDNRIYKGLDSAIQNYDYNYNIPPPVEFWGHCSNLQVWYESGYDTTLLHTSLAFPLLRRLSEVGDPLAKRVFKEEVVKRLMSGNLNVVLFILNQSYINLFTKEEQESILREFRPYLEELIDIVIKDDKQLKQISLNQIKRFRKENWALNAINLYFAKLCRVVKGSNKEDFELLIREPLSGYFRSKNKEAHQMLCETSINFLRFLINILTSTDEYIIDYDDYPENDITASVEEYFYALGHIPSPLLNMWLARVIPDLDAKEIRFMFRKGFFKFLTYNDIRPFLDNPESILLEYFVLYEEEIFFIEEIPPYKNDYIHHPSTSDKWLYNHDFKHARLSIRNKSIRNISQIQGLERIKNLETLDLQDNKISELRGFEYLKSLKKLYLSGNNITNIPDLTQFESLEILDLNNNKISKIDIDNNTEIRIVF